MTYAEDGPHAADEDIPESEANTERETGTANAECFPPELLTKLRRGLLQVVGTIDEILELQNIRG